MSPYYIAFLSLGAALIGLELYGVKRSGGRDTISAMWWEARNRFPVLVVAMVGFLGWLLYHFALEGWRGVRRKP